jgi:hypothetical protein
MRHADDGKLRAFLDGALAEGEHEAVQRHLASCPRCAEQAAVLEARNRRVHMLLAELEPQVDQDVVAPRIARARLEASLHERKERKMARNPFSRRYRPAWAAALLVMVVVLTLTVPPVRSLAGELLGLFRVQTIQFTPVSEDDWPDEATLQAVAPRIDRMFDQTLSITAQGEKESLTETLARERAGFPVRLPAGGEENAQHEWTPPMHISFEIDLPQIEAVFAELGYQQIDLPTTLDGETVEADFAGILATSYGACDLEGGEDRDCITFVQMPSPSASVPDGLDINQLGRVYLELLGMPVEEATHLSERIDWTTTLVLPFPHHINITHETIQVDGVEGSLIHSESSYRPTPEYLLTWVKDDIIYAIAGKGNTSEGLALAASLE